MFYPESFGTAPFALSVLDGGLTGVGSSAALVLDEVITAARIADARGYARFWMSEHHAMPGASIASPPLMAARLVGETHRIRLGAGGVMLPNHAPLAIAEQFGMLEALAPGRIDLGVGRAPGTDHTTAAALRRHGSANEEFPQQVQELIALLNDDPSAAPVNVHAVPGPWQEQQNATDAPALPPELWILGSSLYSAQLAAALGRPYAFALQFGSPDVVNALRIYRQRFRPSRALSEPYAIVSVGAVAEEDPAQARRESTTNAMGMMRMFQGETFALPSPDAVRDHPSSAAQRQFLDDWTDRTFHGTAAEVSVQLEELHSITDADELMLVTGSHGVGARSTTLELIADHYGAGDSRHS